MELSFSITVALSKTSRRFEELHLESNLISKTERSTASRPPLCARSHFESLHRRLALLFEPSSSFTPVVGCPRFSFSSSENKREKKGGFSKRAGVPKEEGVTLTEFGVQDIEIFRTAKCIKGWVSFRLLLPSSSLFSLRILLSFKCASTRTWH